MSPLFILLALVTGPVQNTPLEQSQNPVPIPKVETWKSQTLGFSGDLVAPPYWDIAMRDHPKVTESLGVLMGRQKSWFTASLVRSFPYQDFIFESLEEAGVPREMFYLALIESGFNSGATSRVGAGGMWQFMPSTAHWMGMKVNQWVDERRDFMVATKQAIRTLKDNYRTFGDWYLAMAAYNAGQGRIRNIIKRTGIRDYWELVDGGHLPAETALYVPRILAASQLAHSSGRLGLPMSWETPLEWTTVALKKSVDLKILAEKAQIPYTDLKDLNRELRYSITPDLRDGYNLKVPLAAKEAVEAALADPGLSLMRYHIYKIRSGDTLSELAQHYGVTIEMIQKYNSGLRPQFLRLGQEILIPALKDVGAYAGRARSLSVPAVLPPAGKNLHVVASGDTLWSLARSRGTTVEILARMNGIPSSAVLSLGQRIKLPAVEGNP